MGPGLKQITLLKLKTGCEGGSSYLFIPANKSDLCVFNKNEGVLFFFPLPHSQFLLIIDLGDPTLGVFFFIWHGQIFEVSLSFGNPGQFHLTNLWSNEQ